MYPAFLSQFFLSDAYWRQVDAQKNANLKKGVSGSVLKTLLVPVPPLPEQRKIAGVLGVVQRAVEQQERMLALTAELKKALLHQLFTAGLHAEPQKQTDIGHVPESWEAVRIGCLGKVVTGATPKTAVPEYYTPPEVDFIAPADLGVTRQIYSSERKISRRGFDAIRGLPKDAILCVCIGSSIGKLGMTSKNASATNQQINSIICNEKHDPAFIYYLLSHFAEYWRGFATFGPVPILSKGAFAAINIAVPPTKNEESEIAECFRALDAKAEVHMRRKALLDALFRALLHQLMTAQLRVHNLDLPELAAQAQET
jgi:type I restriction enzyme S subunit